jgi:glutamyl-tRNA reductase
MLEKEIKILKDYIGKDEESLDSEIRKINEQIEMETAEFFSKYMDSGVDESLKDEFRKSLRDIYMEKIEKKRSVIDAIASKVQSFEQKYI